MPPKKSSYGTAGIVDLPVEVVDLLYSWHPHLRMNSEVAVQPCRASFLGSYADEIRIQKRSLANLPIRTPHGAARNEESSPLHIVISREPSHSSHSDHSHKG